MQVQPMFIHAAHIKHVLRIRQVSNIIWTSWDGLVKRCHSLRKFRNNFWDTHERWPFISPSIFNLWWSGVSHITLAQITLPQGQHNMEDIARFEFTPHNALLYMHQYKRKIPSHDICYQSEKTLPWTLATSNRELNEKQAKKLHI